MIYDPFLRLIFILPTLLYATSVAIRLIIRKGRGSQEPPVQESEADKRNFGFSLIADCLILNFLNGIIIIFGVGQVIFGIELSVAGVMISLFGMSSLFAETDAVRELFLTISNIIILGEVVDLTSFSYIASAALIVGLVALLLYYSIRISGEFDTPAI